MRRAEIEPFKPKISGGSGALMMLVAFVLDILPLIVLVGVVALVFSVVTSVIDGTVTSALCQRDGWWGGVMKVLEYHPFDPSQSDTGLTLCNVSKATGFIFGGGLSAFIGFWAFPFIFIISTIVASLVAFLLFPLWFYFGYGYNMVSFTHPGKVIVNVTSVMFTAILKWMPIVNLFPIPVYTLTVWRHVRLSCKEDKKKYDEAQGRRRAQATRDGFMQGRAPRQVSNEEVEEEMIEGGVFAT